MAVAGDDKSLRTLFDAIVARDRATVSRLLGAMPQLARVSLAPGSAGRSGDHFFDEISHYAYAGDTTVNQGTLIFDHQASTPAAITTGNLFLGGAEVVFDTLADNTHTFAATTITTGNTNKLT